MRAVKTLVDRRRLGALVVSAHSLRRRKHERDIRARHTTPGRSLCDQPDREDFHEAISKKNINQMVSLFAPNATGTFGPGKTVTGKEQIREGLAEVGCIPSPRHNGCPTIPRTS